MQHPDPLGRGYDFRHNESVELSNVGSYSTDLFSARAEHVIGNHNTSQVSGGQCNFEVDMLYAM